MQEKKNIFKGEENIFLTKIFENYYKNFSQYIVTEIIKFLKMHCIKKNKFYNLQTYKFWVIVEYYVTSRPFQSNIHYLEVIKIFITKKFLKSFTLYK